MSKSTTVGQESCGTLSQEISSGLVSAWSSSYFADSARLDDVHRDDVLHSRIAELAGALVSGAPIGDVLRKVTAVSIALVPGVDLAKISLIDHGRLFSIAATSQLSAELDGAQRRTGQGPCLDAIGMQKAVRCDDLRTDGRWPRFAQAAAAAGARSVLSCPILGATTSTLSLFGFQPKAFRMESDAIGAVLASQAAIGLINEKKERQFEAALATRDVIGQAKGLIMADFDVDAPRAFAMLTAISQNTNTPVRDLADKIIDSLSKHNDHP